MNMMRHFSIPFFLIALVFGCSDEGEKTCTGWATSCGMLSGTEQCTEQLGCDETGGCTGNATNCLALTNADMCISQFGCSGWSGDCIGDVQACSGYSSRENCENQSGCVWDFSASACGGSPTWCVAFLDDKDECENQDDCLFFGGCNGIETECSELNDYSFCNRQDGCTWDSERCGGTAVPCEELTPEQCERQSMCRLE
jgi:hypothetical protein